MTRDRDKLVMNERNKEEKERKKKKRPFHARSFSVSLLANRIDKVRSRSLHGAMDNRPTVLPNPAKQYEYPLTNGDTRVNGSRGIVSRA